MRRVLPGIFTALSLLVLSACGSAPTPETVPDPAPQEPEAPPEPTVEELKIQQIEDLLASLLLSDTLFQPLLCAILGLIPSCAVSVLLSELFVGGTISFGALIAGLSTGAGFGYIVLFQDKEGRRRALPVIAATFVVAVLGGMLVQVFYG